MGLTQNSEICPCGLSPKSNRNSHILCEPHGHCLHPIKCTEWKYCPLNRNKEICPFHKYYHLSGLENLHVACVSHGHCLYPMQCTDWKFCPINIKNKI